MKTEIIYEDKHILVCYKPAGIAVQTASSFQQDMVSELKNYLAGKGEKNPYIGVVHRLDQPVSGVLVFARNQAAAASLCAQVQNGGMEKIYRTLVYGSFPERAKEGILEDILLKDAKTNTSHIVKADSKEAKLGKKAKLAYKVLEEYVTEEGTYSKLEIKLFTGRHHQIRVQMAGNGHAILGDSKYGNEESLLLSGAMKEKGLKLCAYRLSFKHPGTGKVMDFQVPEVPW